MIYVEAKHGGPSKKNKGLKSYTCKKVIFIKKYSEHKTKNWSFSANKMLIDVTKNKITHLLVVWDEIDKVSDFNERYLYLKEKLLK